MHDLKSFDHDLYNNIKKTDDKAFSDFIGLSTFPSIVYYEHGNPHIYDGKFFHCLHDFVSIFQ